MNFSTLTKTYYYKQIRRYWNFQAKTFLILKSNLKIVNKIVKILKIKKCKNILEIGCGFARDAVFFTQKTGSQITCVDISLKMIKLAKTYVKEKKLENKINFILGNILNIKLKKDFFDGIIAKFVLHHLFSKNDIRKVIKSIYNSLKPNGIFILVENWANPNPSKYEKRVCRLSQKVRRLKGIKGIFLKKDEYLAILKRIGFRNIKYEFIKESINIDRYALNKTLKEEVEKIKSTFPKGKISTLFLHAYK